jgi:hypothetical protein
MPSLDVYAQDGRYMLNRLTDRYDVIAIDAYRPPYIPWHLTTVEFFAEVRAKLTDDGVVAINVGRTPDDRRLVDALSRVLAETFASVHAIDVPRSFNTILIATQTETGIRALEENLATLPADVNPLLLDVLVTAAESLVPVNYSDLLFTDNRAPVETLVDSLVVNFLLSGDTDLIR